MNPSRPILEYLVHVFRLDLETTIYGSIVDLWPVKSSEAFQPFKNEHFEMLRGPPSINLS